MVERYSQQTGDTNCSQNPGCPQPVFTLLRECIDMLNVMAMALDVIYGMTTLGT